MYIQVTNMVKTEAAMLANKSVSLSKPRTLKSAQVPKAVSKSNKTVVKAARKLRLTNQNPNVSDQELAHYR